MFLLSYNRKRKKKFHVKPSSTFWTILILSCSQAFSIHYASSPFWHNLKGKPANLLSQTNVQLLTFISSINTDCAFVIMHPSMSLPLETGGLRPVPTLKKLTA